VDNRVRNTWHCVVRFSGPGAYRGIDTLMNSERRELRKRIREFVEQNRNKFGKAQKAADSNQKLNTFMNINIGTDEKPKYVWRVCK
jgi:hypothetical protein